MSGPHFQLYAQGSHGSSPDLVRWRLLAGNNRNLGSAARTHDTADAALTEIHSLVADLCTVDRRLTRGASDDLWWWTLRVADLEIATASRGYRRRVECELSVHQFVALAGTATTSPTVRIFDGGRSRVSRRVAWQQSPSLTPR